MKQEIINLIKQYETIILHRHVRPDPDAYGSQAGLGAIIRETFPEKKVYLAGQPEPTLNFLAELDEIKDETFEGALIIVCDTANTERIDDQRYLKGAKVIKIDHHPNEDPYGDLLWVDTSASSASEMIYELYLSADGELKMSDEAARLIYGGIVGDTGRFLFPSATQKTFDYAGELIKYNFDRTALYNDLYEMDAHVLKLQGYVLQNFEMSENGAAYLKLTKEKLSEFGALPSEASLLVSTLGSVKGIKAWVFFIEEDKEIRVRLRSKKPVVNELAKEYNGGGHPLAAGASIQEWSDADIIIEKLETLCRN
ncbi:bifunctional oligoribonuclease/PAP phosphatase NrnA [Jeotgalibacillus sp. R-1-5s-1]|uniref:DHH family phosphoesterase n=1 Tax=Jeotgalibacillus sp. R-1-5s-1 TaxID=2555897 RepID=UPI00106A79A6|nr:bifunctional oligoribonuclease/PAP phosphatase NrnA [Jeotgalibacillus sp. R-1-5s-1]TFD92503.1 bifunctional oligoribonuclease/PAP phosphatase NrnA [Jeotgalibacillus sp. R-1-5s-1]